jgi:hypothetical protein
MAGLTKEPTVSSNAAPFLTPTTTDARAGPTLAPTATLPRWSERSPEGEPEIRPVGGDQHRPADPADSLEERRVHHERGR